MKKLFSKFKSMSKSKKIIICAISIIVILIVIVVCAVIFKPEAIKEIKKKLAPVKTEEVAKKITIFNTESKTRPIAVMINNHNQARPYHSGLDKAQIVYEFIVEGD